MTHAWFDQFIERLVVVAWAGKVAWIAGAYLLAWLIHRLAHRVAGRIVRLSHLGSDTRQLRPERQTTLNGLVASAISVIAFTAATLVSLGQFVPVNTLVWMVGLFSAAFGLGARPLLSDFLSGVSFIFEDTFAVGEKVALLDVEGVVEAMNLRTTWVRAPTGEIYVVPNGEVRVVRNFSRGRFSTADIKLRISACDLDRALPLLEDPGKEVAFFPPNLLETWQVISSQVSSAGC